VCWKGKQSNYQEISDFVEKNPNNEQLKEFEKRLEDISFTEYRIYNYRFKEKKTFYEISKELDDMPTAYISKSLESIMLAFQIFFT
jgi:hypothetical protein